MLFSSAHRMLPDSQLVEDSESDHSVYCPPPTHDCLSLKLGLIMLDVILSFWSIVHAEYVTTLGNVRALF